MDKSAIISKIIDLVEKEIGDSEVSENDVINMLTIEGEDSFKNVLSSLSLISVLVSLEREYKIEISDEELFGFATISGLAEIVYQKVVGVRMGAE